MAAPLLPDTVRHTNCTRKDQGTAHTEKKPSKAHPETFAVDEAYKHFIAVWVGDDDTGDLPQKELLQDFLACGQLIGSL